MISLDAFHLRSACLQDLLMDLTLSFTQGGGLVDRSDGLVSFKGATVSREVEHRSINLAVSSSTGQEGSRGSCC